jgi:hypothetical protein
MKASSKMNFKKAVVGISLLFLSLFAQGQEKFLSDSLLYSLTKRTIGNFNQIRLVRKVEMPDFWDSYWGRLKLGRRIFYDEGVFDEENNDFVTYQLKHPQVKRWSLRKLRKVKVQEQDAFDVRGVISGFSDEEYSTGLKYSVCLPVVSRDLKRVVIYHRVSARRGHYQSWSTEWVEKDGVWTKLYSGINPLDHGR